MGNSFAKEKNTTFGLQLKNTNLIHQKIELVKIAITSPFVSEDIFEILCKKLENDELTEEKILKNIQTLRNEETLTGEELDIIAKRIDVFMLKHQITNEELKSLFEIKPELIPLIGHKTIKCSKDIFNLLKINVYGQNEASISLSVFCYQWLSYWNSLDNNVNAIEPPQKAKILIGGTGSGKTFIINEIAKILNLEIIRIDATSLVTTGYVGSNISTEIISGMISKGIALNANKKFIILIDEFDKLAKQNAEIKGKSILFELLTILESKFIKGQNSYKKDASQSEVSMQNVIFVFAGAFEGMISKQNVQQIGFKSNFNTTFSKFNTEDIISYGIPREVMGRISTPIELNQITIETLNDILFNSPKGLKYYKSYFQRENILYEESDYNDDLFEIIKESLAKNLGTRGLFASLSEYFEQVIINLEY